MRPSRVLLAGGLLHRLPSRLFGMSRIEPDSSCYLEQTGWIARRPLRREIGNTLRRLNA
jgi:hypothetical protein